MTDEKLTESDKENLEFEQAKKDGFYQPDENAESEFVTTRKSSLAYGAVISLVGAILFFLGIGWALDTYFLTFPIMLVSGIIFGSVLGFYQFYRLSSKFE
jgi:F0F1-type ATP synthase assembly protein I